MNEHLTHPESLNIGAELRRKLEGQIELLEDAVVLVDAATSALNRARPNEDDVLTVRELALQLPRIMQAVEKTIPFAETNALRARLMGRLTSLAGDPPDASALRIAARTLRIADAPPQCPGEGGGNGFWWWRSPKWALYVDHLSEEGKPDVPIDHVPRSNDFEDGVVASLCAYQGIHTFRSHPYPSLRLSGRTEVSGTVLARREGLLFIPRSVEDALLIFYTNPGRPKFEHSLAMLEHLSPHSFVRAASGERTTEWYSTGSMHLDWRAFVVNVSDAYRPALSIAFRADERGQREMNELKALLR